MNQYILLVAAGIVVLIVADFLLRRTLLARMESRAREQARRVLDEAELDAGNRRRDAELSAREMAEQAEAEALQSLQARQDDLDRQEEELRERLAQAEQEKRRAAAEADKLAGKQKDLDRRGQALQAAEEELEQRQAEMERRIEQVADMTRQEARDRLAREMVEEARRSAAEDVQRVVRDARAQMDERLKDVIIRALQRSGSGSHVESTVSVIRLPSDDMKGRVIGREGRNIRSIEMTTGIDLIVDDTPGTILVSSFDPVRRETARIAIERLVEDGRIHPGRIEEVVEKAREDLEKYIEETGEAAVYEMGLQEVHPRLLPLLGRLKYHTAQGQNLLQHCRETAEIAGNIARELGQGIEVAVRAGLLHEIAQAEEGKLTGPSASASAEMAGRHGESQAVQEAISATHPDTSPDTVPAALVRLACKLSRTRVGARKPNLEIFVSRMRRLEGLAREFEGVKDAHAFRAGRELRVLVEAGALSDEQARALTRDIASRIESEREFTTAVKVTVLRETRAVGYAL